MPIPQAHLDYLLDTDVDNSFIGWLTTHPGDWQEAWETYPGAGGLLWLADFLYVGRDLIVLAACDCADLSQPYIPDGETRPWLAISMARAYIKHKVPIEELVAARCAVLEVRDTYGSAAPCGDAARAAWAVANAAHSRLDWFIDAEAAVWASIMAANGQSEEDGDIMRVCCVDAVRKRIPWELVEAAINRTLDNWSK